MNADEKTAEKAQNTNFSPNCICRASPAVRILPVVGVPKPVLGAPRFTWFSELKSSQRNCRYFVSVKRKFFMRLVSSVAALGPGSSPTPDVPNTNRAGLANALGLNHRSALGLDTCGSPTISGRAFTPLPSVAPGTEKVSGAPETKL